jgi:malate synthase
VAEAIFDEHIPGPNQIARKREDVQVSAADLLRVPTGTCTEEGLRNNVWVGIQYIESWLRGNGAVPLHHLMEDAATAEIARTQVWQWLADGTEVGGLPLTEARLRQVIEEEMECVRQEVGEPAFTAGRFSEARELFQCLCLSEELEEFLTIPAYQHRLPPEALEKA